MLKRTCSKVLQISSKHVLRLVEKLIFVIYTIIYVTVVAASQVERWYNLSTGCSQLNETLGHAGIPINGIVEIFGQSGAGKTQLCLQLALMAQLPKEYGGLNKSMPCTYAILIPLDYL